MPHYWLKIGKQCVNTHTSEAKINIFDDKKNLNSGKRACKKSMASLYDYS